MGNPGADAERRSDGLLPRSDVIGGAEGDRTPDLMTASHALSQLSYGPNFFWRGWSLTLDAD